MEAKWSPSNEEEGNDRQPKRRRISNNGILSASSSDEEVRTRYAEFAKMYHPDKIRKEAAPELLSARQKVFALISEAAAALETEDQRYRYMHDLDQGLVRVDLFTRLLEPLNDLAFDDAFANFGEPEFVHGGALRGAGGEAQRRR